MKTIGKKAREWFPMKSEADAYVQALGMLGYADAKIEKPDYSGWLVIRGELSC